MFIRIQRRLKSNKRKNMIILLFFFFFTCFISVGYSSLINFGRNGNKTIPITEIKMPIIKYIFL